MDTSTDSAAFNVDTSKLPLFLQELISLLGEKDAYTFVATYGGQTKYIPRDPNRSHLRHLLSVEGLKRLSQVMGGIEVEVPMLVHFERQRRNHQIMAALQRGQSRNQVAQQYGLSVRQIANIRRNISF